MLTQKLNTAQMAEIEDELKNGPRRHASTARSGS
jgi:hypothetical protein